MIQKGDLTNRAAGPPPFTAADTEAAVKTFKGLRPADDLARLRAQIEHARRLMAPRGSCCGHCFGRGVAAVLAILDEPV